MTSPPDPRDAAAAGFGTDGGAETMSLDGDKPHSSTHPLRDVEGSPRHAGCLLACSGRADCPSCPLAVTR